MLPFNHTLLSFNQLGGGVEGPKNNPKLPILLKELGKLLG